MLTGQPPVHTLLVSSLRNVQDRLAEYTRAGGDSAPSLSQAPGAMPRLPGLLLNDLSRGQAREKSSMPAGKAECASVLNPPFPHVHCLLLTRNPVHNRKCSRVCFSLVRFTRESTACP